MPSYSEYLLLNKAQTAPPPDPHETGVRVYADTDGTLHTLQSDGTDAEVGSGGGGSPVITRATYDIPSTSVANDGALHDVPLAFNYGTELLDLTTPDAPTPVDDGIYSFAVYVQHSDDGAGATKLEIRVTLDDDDFGASVVGSTALRNDSIPKQTAVTLPFYAPAGSPCKVSVSHDANSAANITGHVQVQRISASGGTGGGGTWVGPFTFHASDYNADLGSGWDGIMIDLGSYTLPADAFILGTAVKIKTSFPTGSDSVVVYAGTLAGDDYQISGPLELAQSVDASLIVSVAGTPSVSGILIDDTISQVWLDDFSGDPGSTGEADLYLNISMPVAP